MNIYIDAGSYKGHKLRKHKADKVYAFEPNPHVECDYDVIRKAVWIRDGKIKIKTDKFKKEIENELMAIKRKDRPNTESKMEINSKQDQKKIIGRSPDFSDAMAYKMIFEWTKRSFTTVI